MGTCGIFRKIRQKLAILLIFQYNVPNIPLNKNMEDSANMEVAYRWKKHYKTAKYPIRQPAWLTWLIWMLSRIALIGKTYSWRPSRWRALSRPISS